MPPIELIVGTLGRARGLAGDLFVDVSTDSPSVRFRPGAELWLDGTRRVTVERFREESGRGLIRFEGLDTRTAAEGLTGATLTVRADPAETPAEPDTYFDHQLLGLMVVTTAGEHAGTIVGVDHAGFQDRLVVATPAGERLVPFVTALVPRVELAAGRVVVEAIPGLLEEEAES